MAGTRAYLGLGDEQFGCEEIRFTLEDFGFRVHANLIDAAMHQRLVTLPTLTGPIAALVGQRQPAAIRRLLRVHDYWPLRIPAQPRHHLGCRLLHTPARWFFGDPFYAHG